MQTATKTKNPAKTANGRNYAKFTMVCDFKPQYQRPNPNTGEVKERWTYRSDLENSKYADLHGGECDTKEINILAHIFNRDNHKYNRCRIFDNRATAKEQLLAEWNNGKLCYPHDTERKVKLLKWLNSIQ